MSFAIIITMNCIAMLAGAGLTYIMQKQRYHKLNWLLLPMSGGLVLSLSGMIYLVQQLNMQMPAQEMAKKIDIVQPKPKLQRHNIADPDTNMWFKIDSVTSTTLSVIPIARLNENKNSKIEGLAPVWEDDSQIEKRKTRHRP